MGKDEKIILQVPLKGQILRAFEHGFYNSGLESKTEYIRSLIRNDFNHILPAYTCVNEEKDLLPEDIIKDE
jgi:hypothetical protein